MTTAAPKLVVPPAIAALKLEFDAGLHSPDGKACIMEVIAMLAGEKWSDRPACASPVIAVFARVFWDRTPKTWQGLLDRADRIAGSATTKEIDRARGYLAADWAVRRFAPRWLRRAGLEEDAVRLESLAPVTDATSARAAYDAGGDIRQHAWKRYEESLDRIRKAAWAAEAAGAAGGVDPLKGKSYAEKKAWFRAKIDEALGAEIEASIDDGFALLDAMLDLQVAA